MLGVGLNGTKNKYSMTVYKIDDTDPQMIFRNTFIKYIVHVPYMDTLRKMHIFHPRIHVIELQKCMITIPGLNYI